MDCQNVTRLLNSSVKHSLALLTGFRCCGPAAVGGDRRPVGGDVPCDAEQNNERNTFYHRAVRRYQITSVKASVCVCVCVCVNNFPIIITWKWNCSESNHQPSDHDFTSTTIALLCHTVLTIHRHAKDWTTVGQIHATVLLNDKWQYWLTAASSRHLFDSCCHWHLPSPSSAGFTVRGSAGNF